jgi:hypothetical protein
MSYTAEISRANPTCFLFLVDQSKSMLGLMPGGQGKTKAEALADAINNLLYNLCLSCVKGPAVLDRFYVGVLGYGLNVTAALGGSLAGRELVPVSDLARNPLRVEQRPAPGSGQTARVPVWFEPVADGKTPMCATLNRAGIILSGFLMEHPHCYPPLVVNLTDGEANDGDPEPAAAKLRQLGSTDGNVLVFNAHLSSRPGPTLKFPDGEARLADPFARRLFRMSSSLPPPMWDLARQAGYSVGPGTRGFVFNADMDAVLQFLNIGTLVNPKNLK